MTNIIVMSTSHYGFLDALGRSDVISGISGPDYLWTEGLPRELRASEYGSSRQALTVRTPRSARPLPSLGEIVKTSLPSLSIDLGPSLLHDEGVHGPDLPDLPTDSERAGAASLDGETHATLGTVRGGTGAERSVASGGASRSEAVEPPELAAHADGYSERSEESGLAEPAAGRNGEEVHRRQPTSVLADVGYDGAPDYETIVSLRPEVVLTYAVSGVESPFVGRLKQLGIKVLTVNEHLERHPLARAAYIRLFGALTGDMATADSVLSVVRTNYTAIAEDIKERGVTPRKVLLNIPYNDLWFVPASDNYLTVMIHDAGGTVLGCEEGKAASTVMSVEKAYSLSKEADCWLNVGWCSTEKDLLGVNPIFSDMLKAIKDNATGMVPDGFPVVWNDNKRVNAKGGNDIWQSGVVRPDLVLRDLAVILHPIEDNNNVIYYKPII